VKKSGRKYGGQAIFFLWSFLRTFIRVKPAALRFAPAGRDAILDRDIGLTHGAAIAVLQTGDGNALGHYRSW
jgi:hypothetical protein